MGFNSGFKGLNIQLGQNSDVLSVKIGGTSSNH